MFVTPAGMATTVRLLQLKKASLPMLVTLSGIVTLARLVQLEKAQDLGRLGVGGLQGRGIAIALGQGRPELLQAAEVAPFGALP